MPFYYVKFPGWNLWDLMFACVELVSCAVLYPIADLEVYLALEETGADVMCIRRACRLERFDRILALVLDTDYGAVGIVFEALLTVISLNEISNLKTFFVLEESGSEATPHSKGSRARLTR